MVVVTVAQDDGIEWAKANAQDIRIQTQYFSLAGVKKNSPIIGLDQYRQTVLREQVGSGNTVVRQHGDSEALDHCGTSREVSAIAAAPLQRSSWPCKRSA